MKLMPWKGYWKKSPLIRFYYYRFSREDVSGKLIMNSKKITLKQPTCPWWFLFTFDNPLRKIYQDPEKILKPYLQPGDTAVDIGCGMGYFTIALARLVGEEGQVIAVDLQTEMLSGLQKRAQRAGLTERIKVHQSAQDRIGVPGPVDFVLAFWMVHEVHHRRKFLEQIFQLLKDGGRLLIAEPYLHVSGKTFQEMVSDLQAIGFSIQENPGIGFSRSILAQKVQGASSWK